MKQKPLYIVLLAVAVIISVGLSLNHYGYLFTPEAKPDYEALGYVRVEATITDVFLSGQGRILRTRLTLRYEYEGETYTTRLELEGNSTGHYNKGSTITRWLDPAEPETLH
jgi:hypothetical protein